MRVIGIGLLVSCITLSLSPLVTVVDAAPKGAAAPAVKQPAGTIKIFSADKLKMAYAYPSSSSIREDRTVPHGKVASFRIQFDPSSSYGGAVLSAPGTDLRGYRSSGELAIWLKGAAGGEKVTVGLGSPNKAGKTVTTSAPLPLKTGLSSGWQQIIIPLNKFSDNGTFWDGKANVPGIIDWSNVTDLNIAVTGQFNRPVVVYLAEVEVRA